MSGGDGVRLNETSSVSREVVVESHDEKRFDVGVGTSAEVLIFLSDLDVKCLFRDAIPLEFLYLAEVQLKAMSAFAGYKLDRVAAKVKPSAAVINDVV